MMRLCLYLSRTQGGFSFVSLRKNIWWLVLYTFLRSDHAVLGRQKNGLTHFTSKCIASFLVLRPKAKKWVSPFHSEGVLHRSRWLSPRCACAQKKWDTPFHHGVFRRTVSLFNIGVSQLHATSSSFIHVLFDNAELSVSYRGGYSRSL